ncbi:MAG: tripartite tricarboxylate transporter TctB family protein [Chloroflexi bacterium]|nr:tripartite tricarboxylate transporter TctB family protein [Chloroflexota bacterium]
MSVKWRVVIPLVVFLVMAAVVFVSFGFPYLQAKLSYIFAGGIVLILALVQFTRDLRGTEKEIIQATEEGEEEIEGGGRAYLREGLWMAAFAVVIWLIGFVVAIPVFGIAYMRKHGVAWKVSVVAAVGWAIFCWATFTFLLDSELYPGLVAKLLGLD